MQVTTATRTVEIYMNNADGITYRNVKDGQSYGPVRCASRATAKAGSVGREILDAIDAAAEAEVEIVTETVEVATETVAPVATEVEIAEGAEIEVAGRRGQVTKVLPAEQTVSGRAWAAVTWETTSAGVRRPSYGVVYLDQLARV